MCRLLIRVPGAVEQKKEKERIMPRKTKEPVVVIQTVPGEGIFVLMDGQRIAERGAGEWIPLERESRFIALPTRVASRWKFAGCGCTSLAAGCRFILLGLNLLLLSPYVLLVGQPCPDPCHFYEKGATFCGNRR